MRLFVPLLALLAPLAQATTVFKCVDAQGHTTFSDLPCAQASVQTDLSSDAPANGLPSPAEVEQTLGSVSESLHQIRHTNLAEAPEAPEELVMPDNAPPPGVVVEFGDPSGISRNPAGL